LIEEDYEVTVIDNLSTGRIVNISDVLDGVRFVQGDIRDLDLLKLEFQGAEVVFHQAALPSVPRSIADPISTNSNNIDGTLNVLVSAKECRVRRVVLASSSSVYGDTEILPKTENMVANPLSPYAVTKYVGEIYAKVFAELYGLETLCLRYFNVFGPYQDPNSQYAAVIPKFINLMIKGERPVIYGDGEQSRDFTYVDNVVEANLLATKVPNVSGDVFNIGCGKRFTLNHLVEVLNELLGLSIEPAYVAPRPGDVRHSMASIDRAREVLGYDPPVSFEEGLEETVRWFMEQF
jgi:UDP-glucose 4-epimerase